jgi:uncharacterized repeat protein (TIGR01451 family)
MNRFPTIQDSFPKARPTISSWRQLLPFLVLLMLSIFLIGTGAAAEATVVIQDFQVNPSVLAPKEVGTIVVHLANTAESATKTITEISGMQGNTVTSSETTPINVFIKSVRLFGEEVEILSGTYNNLVVLGPGQSIPFTFLIRAPQQTGIYFTKISITIVGGQSVSYTIPVNVNTQISVPKEPAILVEKTVPEQVIPGEQFAVTLKLTNQGLSAADNFDLTLQSNSTSLLALTPNTFHINRLEPNQSESLLLEFATDKNTRLGLSSVTLLLDYVGPSGVRKHQTEVIGIQVQGKADMSIALISTNPTRITVGDSVDLTIRIENIGTADANSVQASLSDLPLPGTREAFMGRIEPNNDAPAVFSLQADRAGEFEYTLVIRYSDEYGDHESQQMLRIAIRDRDYSGLLLAGGAILIVVLIAGSIWFWRRKGN